MIIFRATRIALLVSFATGLALMLSPVVAQSPAKLNHASTDSSQLRALMDRVWEFELDEDPLLATDVGDPRGQDRLPEVSVAAADRRLVAVKAFLAELTRVKERKLSAAEAIDFEVLKLRLQRRVADHRFGLHLMPINNREGFHISFPELPRLMNPKSEQDFENYISRLKDFSRYTDEHIELMRAGIKAELVPPSVIMRDSPSQAEAHVVNDPAESLLLTELSEVSIDRLSNERWSVIRAEIIDAVRNHVVPAYRRFASFLKDEYLPACRGTIAAEALPDGRALYREQIRKFTTLDVTAEELHQIGVQENAKIRKQMLDIVKQVEFDGDLPDFLSYLRTDPKFYARTSGELLKEVAFILKQADGRLPDLFGRLPRIPYGIREIPAYVAPQTTSAYYWPPATDGSRGGFYYVNTYNLSSRPLYQLEALSLHEAVPGHHLQLALQAELDGLHPIRKQSSFTAFIEGWGLYSEWLGYELGFYQDPYQEFGRLSMEAWRASRLVVDTGIHAKGWSRTQAITYMKENTALSEHNIVAEVDRYIGWPGQALGYKVGERFIRRLRDQAEAELGNRFDVREFHDVVLANGSIPLPVLERTVNAYLQRVSETSVAP